MDQHNLSQTTWPITLLKCVVAAICAFSLIATFLVAHNEHEFLASILGIACLAVLAYPLFAQKEVSVFEPITMMVILAIIGIPLKILYTLWTYQTDAFVADFVLLNKDPEMFLYGTFIVLIGFLFFIVGYLLKFPTPPLQAVFLPNIKEWNGKRLQLAILVIGTISVLSLFAFIAAAGVSFSSFTSMSQKRFLEFRAEGGERMHTTLYLFCRGAAFAKFIAYFCFVWILYRKKSFWSLPGFLFAGSVLITILLAVMLNSRAGVALLLLDCAILSYFLLKKVNVKLVVISFAVASVLMIAMLSARHVNQGSEERANVSSVVQRTLCGRNMLDIAKCCHIVDGVPRKMEYRNGEMLYAWLAAPIPTSVWPDKPKWATQGMTLNQKIFGYRGTKSGCPPGLIGELYWNFGTTGIWFGMFFAGLVYRQLYMSFRPYRTNPTAILIYTMLFSRFFLFSLANDLGTGIVKAGLDLVPIYLTLIFIGVVNDPTPTMKTAADTRLEVAS